MKSSTGPITGRVGRATLATNGDAGLLLLDATECAFPPPRHPAGRLVASP